MNTGSIFRFWASTAASNNAVVFPVSECPLSKHICPIGMPGTEVTVWYASERGIHSCSLNFALEVKPFLDLKPSKLKLA